jgi:glutathione synthase/RimK-type ligase-like ATP-grasp enzyme
MVELSRISLNVLFGIPNRAQRTVGVSPDGRYLQGRKPGPGEAIFIGSVNLARHLDPQRFVLERFYLKKGPLRLNVGPGPFLNHIADPDTCSGALEMAARVVDQVPRPCFNPPAAIARTTRHEVARMLAGIASLTVPKTLRVPNTTPSGVRDAIAKANLVFPVLVRGVGMHGGMSLIKADNPGDIERVAQLEPKSQELYVTEFHDFRSRDGRYRKFRVVVVGGEIFLRHCVIADNWLLHGRRRTTGTEELEVAMYAHFEREWRAHLRPVFREIATRLGLDFFGVDCNIDEDGRVLLFEANACMNILHNYRPSPNIFDTPIARIKSAVEELLAAPSTWYSAAVP